MIGSEFGQNGYLDQVSDVETYCRLLSNSKAPSEVLKYTDAKTLKKYFDQASVNYALELSEYVLKNSAHRAETNEDAPYMM